jgi:hypothetical protein
MYDVSGGLSGRNLAAKKGSGSELARRGIAVSQEAALSWGKNPMFILSLLCMIKARVLD